MTEFPKIFAHRGAPTLAPENTIASFAKASEIGARWCECDVGVMADGTLLIIHDDTVDRTTNSSGSWDSWGYGELRRLDAGAWFSPTYRFERIPELADVVSFANSTQTGFNFELKPREAGRRRDAHVSGSRRGRSAGVRRRRFHHGIGWPERRLPDRLPAGGHRHVAAEG